MTCPYCAESIKDEAVVCAHCQRDLAFFKPFDERLKTIECDLAALAECVSKISAFLDREPISADADPKVSLISTSKPGFAQMVLVVAIEFILSLIVLAVFIGLTFRLSELPTGVLVGFLIVLFAVPVALGILVGIRWKGRNLKRYLLLGLMAGSLVIAIPMLLMIVLTISSALTLSEAAKPVFWIIMVGLGRDIFGFTCGGLLGDVIEKRRHPDRYVKSSERFALRLPSQIGTHSGRFATVNRSVSSFLTTLSPVIPLIGVVITVFGGYYLSRHIEKEKTTVEAVKPSPSPQPSVP